MAATTVHQGLLIRHLKELFKGDETHVNSKTNSNIKYSNGSFLELDIWIPTRNICFEFQKKYNIETISSIMNIQVINNEFDVLIIEKNELIRINNLSVVVVPCWWDGQRESLISTINFHRPDLFDGSDNHNPIPINPPLDFFPLNIIPGVGELMLASFPIDSKFKLAIPHEKWWVGEKYDGIRFCWNPERQKLYTRAGRELTLLDEAPKYLPHVFLDGEIWFGRGNFSLSYTILIGSENFVNWPNIRVITFDNPSFEFQQNAFEDRYSSLLSSVPFDHSLAIVAPRMKTTNGKQINKLVQEIIEEEGEGIMLREAGSLYQHGRNSSLFKLKSAMQDREGIVVEITDDQSVILKLPSGQTFTVPKENVYISLSLLSVGDIVSFSFEHHARRNIPINPEITKIRNDVNWDDVVSNAINEEQYLNEHSRIEGGKKKPREKWSINKLRKYMISVAKRRNMDLSIPSTWLHIFQNDILQLKRGNMSSHNIKKLQLVFPNINFSSVVQLPGIDIESRRQFFENYARENNFNSQNAENWYVQPRKRIATFAGASSIIDAYKGSLSKALLNVFPNIGLDKNKLWDRTQWDDIKNRKKFFERYARDNSFDPLLPDNWYSQKSSDILSSKAATRVIFYHKNSVGQALVDLFPNIGLSKKTLHNTYFGLPWHRRIKLYGNQGNSKFWDRVAWSDYHMRRKLFESYASAHNFDPLVASNWAKQERHQIMKTKWISRMLAYHDNNIVKALCYLFTELTPFESQLSSLEELTDPSKQRNVLEAYANQNNFDPLVPDNWYLQPRDKLLSFKDVRNVISYYKGNLVTAMVSIFPDVHLDPLKLFSYSLREQQRKFFIKFAESNNFDPHNPENWYSLKRNHIVAIPGAFAIMAKHDQSISQALVDLFPEMKWEKERFMYLTQKGFRS